MVLTGDDKRTIEAVRASTGTSSRAAATRQALYLGAAVFPEIGPGSKLIIRRADGSEVQILLALRRAS